MLRVRSGPLASWASAWLAGAVSYDAVIDVVTADDEPHRVLGLPGTADRPEGVPLGWALSAFRDTGVGAVLAVLPAPGDPRGLPGPGEFSTAAMAAEEGVASGGLGLVPTVRADSTVIWQAYDIRSALPDPPDVREAEVELADALRRATDDLADLDVASWRPERADGLFRTREPALPPGCTGPAVRLLAQADRLSAVVDLASADSPGGAVNGSQARAREDALRPLTTAIRRARLAAYNAVATSLR